MTDCKERMTQDFVERLTPHFNNEEIALISEALTKTIAHHSITEQSTAVVVRDDRNERLLKRYAACLSVDGKSHKTIQIYVSRLKSFSDFLGVPYTEIGTYDIRYYLASMKEAGVSARTLENYRSYISAFYQWLAREDVIAKNPCEKIQPIKYTEEVRHPFSDIEIDAIRSACTNERDRALVEILLSSGLRVAELSSLDVDDVDFATLSIHIRSGKGNKERMTYMTDVCAMHLKKYLFSRPQDTPLFLSAKKRERLTTSGIRAILRGIGKASGVSDVHPHRFRRTFATNLSKRGMDVQTIAKLMGHTNIQTTMIYVAMDDSRILNEYKKHTA